MQNQFDGQVGDVVARALARAKNRGARTSFQDDPEAVAAYAQAARLGLAPGAGASAGGPAIEVPMPEDVPDLGSGGGAGGGGPESANSILGGLASRSDLFRRLLSRRGR